MSNEVERAAKWLSNLFASILTWISGKEKELAPAITIADNVLNAIKTFESGAIGQTIEGVIEAEIPASTGLINAFKLQLPIWLIELNWIKSEAGKNLTDQWNDAMTYLNSITDDKVRASQYNTLKALFIHFFGSNSSDGLINIQQALTLAQPTYNSDILK